MRRWHEPRRAPARAAFMVAFMLAGIPVVHAATSCGENLTVDTVLSGDLACPGGGLRLAAGGITLWTAPDTRSPEVHPRSR